MNIYEATITDLATAMANGHLSAQQIVTAYQERIAQLDQGANGLHAVLELNPEALALAAQSDVERAFGRVRGPLHGIPILLKDNIATTDTMQTTAGSLALLQTRPAHEASVVTRLRQAGAIILGKTNMSEWANFRSTRSSSGWSARGGQTRNPYLLDRSPCGSSSGSAVAVAASLCAAALSTETDGSIVCPASVCGVVGLKPTVGLTSRAGVIPISTTQDSVGVHARSLHDAALVLTVIAGGDPADPATAACPDRDLDYTQMLDPDGLRGARIGVLRGGKLWGYHPGTDRIASAVLAQIQACGATLIDPIELPANIIEAEQAEFDLLLYEFKAGLNDYLTKCQGERPRSLADLIAFNLAHSDQEMPYFGQEIFLLAEAKGDLATPAYHAARAQSHDQARSFIDTTMATHDLDALVMPGGSPAWTIDLVNGDHFLGGSAALAARAGYPLVNIPAGYIHGLPVGISLMGRAFSEPHLLRLAYALEHALPPRRPPIYLPTFRR
ncbi:amidase [Candidatus Oscillochloris fontis]|uniref:amidase n=1 Tax=Candidatus Oscillochloris fontis TaxID=2496868 RepID=UPI00101BAAA3|nr:amidase [Candidatus Oscillochloris fontis]